MDDKHTTKEQFHRVGGTRALKKAQQGRETERQKLFWMEGESLGKFLSGSGLRLHYQQAAQQVSMGVVMVGKS